MWQKFKDWLIELLGGVSFDKYMKANQARLEAQVENEVFKEWRNGLGVHLRIMCVSEEKIIKVFERLRNIERKVYEGNGNVKK